MFAYLSLLNPISDQFDDQKSIRIRNLPISSNRVTIGNDFKDNIRIYDSLGSDEPDFQIELFNNNIESNEFFVRLLKGKQFEINGKPFLVECRKIELRNNDRLTIGPKTFVFRKCRHFVSKPIISEPESQQTHNLSVAQHSITEKTSDPESCQSPKTVSIIENEAKQMSIVSEPQTQPQPVEQTNGLEEIVSQTLTPPLNISTKDDSESERCHQLEDIPGNTGSESVSIDIKANKTKAKQNISKKSDKSDESNAEQTVNSKRSGKAKSGRSSKLSKQHKINDKTDETVVITTSRRTRRNAVPTEVEAPVQQIDQKSEPKLINIKRPLKPVLESSESTNESQSVIKTRSKRNEKNEDIKPTTNPTIETKLINAVPNKVEAPVQQIDQKSEPKQINSKRPLKPLKPVLESCESTNERESVIKTRSKRNEKKEDIKPPNNPTIETKLIQQNIIQTNKRQRKTNSTVDIITEVKEKPNKKRTGLRERAVELVIDVPKETVESKTDSKPINKKKRGQKPVEELDERTGPSLRSRNKRNK